MRVTRLSSLYTTAGRAPRGGRVTGIVYRLTAFSKTSRRLRSSSAGVPPAGLLSVGRTAAEGEDLLHPEGGAEQRHLVEAAGHELHGERQSIGADPLGKLIDGHPSRDHGAWNDGLPVVSGPGARFDAVGKTNASTAARALPFPRPAAAGPAGPAGRPIPAGRSPGPQAPGGRLRAAATGGPIVGGRSCDFPLRSLLQRPKNRVNSRPQSVRPLGHNRTEQERTRT